MKQTMRVTVLALILISNIGFSQNNPTNLEFDTKYYNAEDKWVAFPKSDKDSSHSYGIIYFDERRGFTFRFRGRFKVEEEKLIKQNLTAQEVDRGKNLYGNLYYLRPGTKLVCVLNENQVQSLNLPIKPEWLNHYHKDSVNIEYKFRLGLELKRAGAYGLALKRLLEAYEIDPHYEYLEMHLSEVYNNLGRYKEAIEILQKAIKNDSQRPVILYSYLTYSLVKLDKIDEAEKITYEGVKILETDNNKFSVAAQMALEFSILGNQDKFDEWISIAIKFAKPNWIMFKEEKGFCRI